MPGATDALAGLRDIHLPDPVAFWPPAPGWWIALVLAFTCAGLAWLGVRRQRANAARAALRELADLEREFRGSGDVASLAARLSALLRRLALVRFPRDEVASLHGGGRAAFLERSRRAGFPSDVFASLECAVYAGPGDLPSPDAEVWIGAARRWIGRRT